MRRSKRYNNEIYGYLAFFLFAFLVAHIYWIKKLNETQLHWKLKVTLLFFQFTLLSFLIEIMLPAKYGFIEYCWKMAIVTAITFIPTLTIQFIFIKINFRLQSLNIL